MAAGEKRDRWESSSDEEEGQDNQPHAEEASEKSSSVPTSKIAEILTTGETAQSERDVVAPQQLQRHNPLLQGCRSVYDSFERLDRLDEGTYGVVWKARDLATDEIVALKQIKFDNSELLKDGFPIAALREINVLLALSHENLVTVREMVVGKDFDKVFMVMEMMEMDLSEAMKRTQNRPFPQADLKHMLHQILSAVDHIHDKWYLHRDLKTSNILVHKSGRIAVCDFGLARKYQLPLKALTQMVITLWYRPPELLFGANVYGPEVDMWSVGCIFAELIAKKALLQGQGELDQINKIFELLGTPSEEKWPGFTSLPNAKIFRWRSKDGSKLRETFPVNSFSLGQAFLDGNGFNLLSRLLALDPLKRISAADALKHPYFHEGVEIPKRPRFQFD